MGPAYARTVRFLLSRRWVLFALVVLLLAYGAWLLGQWQFQRLEDRRLSNDVVARNLAAAPAPVEDVLSPDRGPTPDQEWLRVSATGTWDDASTVVLRYQTRDGGPGVDVVTPLVTDEGTAVLVDRGWLSTANSGAARPELPPASTGEVTVTGYVRADAVGRATTVEDFSTRAISSVEIAELTPYPLYQGFLDLAEESPEPETALEPVVLPDDDSEGPHFFYGLQWWFFGALAVFGFGYLAWDERRGGAGRQARRELLERRRAEAGSRRADKAREAEQLAAWRYGERDDRPDL
jgi:cytochrome oxidase assembly protein ShyY1